MGICSVTQGTQTGVLQPAERWDGDEDGMRFGSEGIWVYLWLLLVDVRQKATKYCKTIILQLKKKEVGCLIPTILA